MEMVARGSIPEVANYKLKINGFHLIGTRSKIEKPKKKIKNSLLDKIFEIAYKESLENALAKSEQISYINDRMINLYNIKVGFDNLLDYAENTLDFSEYIEKRLKQIRINLIMRKKRFLEKANLHCWNFFVTQTYDSEKFKTEEEFAKAYLTCLSHLSTEYGWRYMLVTERGKQTGRLHFHGIFYIPTGKMKGFLKESKYFSPVKHRMEKSMINSFFAVRFGRNDFQCIDKNITGISNYISKYITKTDCKIVYSRHIDNSLEIELCKDDINIGYKLSYCVKFIVADELLKNTILDPEIKRGQVLSS